MLLARDPAKHAALNNPSAVRWLLDTLRRVGAEEQITALLARGPAAHADLDPLAFATLLGGAQEAKAEEQIAVLAERLPAAGHFSLLIMLEGKWEQFRLGREPNGSAAPSWTWNDMD